MADIAEALVAMAGEHAGLTALIGSRFYPGLAPSGELRKVRPCICYHQIDRPTADHLRGADLPHPRLQFSIWAKSRAAVKAIAAQFRDCFKPYRGPIGDFTVDCLRVVDERDSDEDPTDGSNTPDYCTQIDVVVWFQESHAI